MEQVFSFGALDFLIKDEEIFLIKCGGNCMDADKMYSCYVFAEVQIVGENKNTHLGAKMTFSSESIRYRYHSHTIDNDLLTIVQRTPKVEVTSYFQKYGDTNAIRAWTKVKNIANEEIVLEEVAALTYCGMAEKGTEDAENLYFTRFHQSHHGECQPRRYSFKDYALQPGNTREGQGRIYFANIGSWSTKEELPQGIIENTKTNDFTMFQIESNNSWYYEIGDKAKQYYLYLGGANLPFGGWCKTLAPEEEYETIKVALSFGKNFNEVVGEMTKYRRHIAGKCEADKDLPVIFNEYMHLSWDCPTEEKTKAYLEAIAKTGAKYYVIDISWHDEIDANIIYPHVGMWEESKCRFPSGVRAITDHIRSYGLKAGLWIEPEVVGHLAKEAIEFYGEDGFLKRNGKRLCVMGRHFLDLRNEVVRNKLFAKIARMIEEYGAEYVKMDYNQDLGVGADDKDSFGAGLEEQSKGYFTLVDALREKYPHVIFETCSSGGMRMDYATLSHFSLVSTSDQVNYKKYPCIAANIFSAVLPEQAAVWSYPVDESIEVISDEQVIMNMINSIFGRMHLASDLRKLTEKQFELVKEGIRYHDKLCSVKKTALPIFPNGLAKFGDEFACVGLKTEEKTYLAVWKLGGEKLNEEIVLEKEIKGVSVAYPKNYPLAHTADGNTLKMQFDKEYQAVIFEIE